jgi:hypothetical protein
MGGAKCAKGVLVACTLALSACSTTPILTWQKDTTSTDPGASMPTAMAFMDSGRNAYRKAVADQMRDEAYVANGLLGAGALITALAVGKVHRDAIVGTALVAGTAYGMGNLNLKRTRVLTYLAGIDALNCSERAVLPYAISASELGAITKAIDELDASRSELIKAINAAKAARDVRKKTDGLDSPLIDATLPNAELTQQSADTTIKAGRQYTASASRAARELVAAVNRIDAAVVRSQIDSTPDLSAVPGVVSGLAGMAGSFAPGAGVETLVADSLKKSISSKSGAKVVDDSVDNLVRAMQDTAQKNTTASALLAGRAVPWAEDAFKDCGVAQIVAPLAVAPTTLSFTVGVDGKRLVDISGGVKPFFVEVDGPSVDGLVVKAPVRFDSRAEVSIVGSKVTKPFETTLRISDSSPTARVVTVPLSVVAASTASAPANAPANGKTPPAKKDPKPNKPGAGGTSLDAALELLKSKGSFKHAGLAFKIPNVPSKTDDKTINVPLGCPDGDAKFKPDAVATSLLAEIGITAKPPARTWDVHFEPVGKNCLN